MTTLPMKRIPMTKSKESGIPAIGTPYPLKETTNAPLAPSKNVAAVEIKSVSIEVPFVSEPVGVGYDGQQCFRCDLGRLTRDQQRKIRAIRRGYILQDRQHSNGGETKSMADAVKALIDSLPI